MSSVTCYKAPQNYPVRIFLAGSIEQGKAVDWQNVVTNHVTTRFSDVVVLNPRGDDWDASWVQSMHNAQFYTQVTWELNAQHGADIIFMHFDGSTMSPISLLELGLFAASGKLIVSCAPEFWRRGNVEMVCFRYGIPLCDNLTDALSFLDRRIESRQR